MNVKIFKQKEFNTFDKSAVNQSSCNFGYVQPSYMTFLNPESSIDIEFSSKTLCLPVRTETYGEVTLRHYIGAVDICDIWRPFTGLISNRPYQYSNLTKIPTTVPYTNFLKVFFMMLNLDQNATVEYVTMDRIVEKGNSRVFYYDVISESSFNNIFNDCSEAFHWAFSALKFRKNPRSHIFHNVFNNEDPIPTSKLNVHNPDPSFHGEFMSSGYDYFIPINHNRSDGLLVRLGEFGAKLRSMFIGLGLFIDDWIINLYEKYFSDEVELCTSTKSILPFMAYAKIIYDTFAIKRNVDYPLTYIGKFIELLSSQSIYNLNQNYGTHDWTYFSPETSPLQEDPPTNIFIGFLGKVIAECIYNAHYSLDVDFFSSINDTVGSKFGTPRLNAVTVYDSQNPSDYEAQAVISNFPSETPDIFDPSIPTLHKLGQRLLRYVNADTIIGASIHKWAKEHGISLDTPETKHLPIHDKYVQQIDFNMLVTMADTAEGNTGDYAGIAKGNGSSGSTKITSKGYTFVFAFYCVVPKVSYYQGNDPMYDVLSWSDFYHDEFDSLGYDTFNSDWFASNDNQVIGVMPRYYQYKFQTHNVVNGCLTRPSSKAEFECYFLDRDFTNSSPASNGQLLTSDTFRKIGLRSNHGNYLRIFQNQSNYDDHFLNFFNYKVTMRSNMKAVSESWDTYEDGENTEIVTKS